jgi:hypothetical protein
MAAIPQLRGEVAQGPSEGVSGQASYGINWRLPQKLKATETGVIMQRITITFNLSSSSDGFTLAGQDLALFSQAGGENVFRPVSSVFDPVFYSSLTMFPLMLQYWEAWLVPKDSDRPAKPRDNFRWSMTVPQRAGGAPSVEPVFGTLTWDADAWYVDGAWSNSPGFKPAFKYYPAKLGQASPGGELYSADISSGDFVFNTFASMFRLSQRVRHQYSVRWPRMRPVKVNPATWPKGTKLTAFVKPG